MSVTVPFPGASSEEVEEDVNRRIEESVNVFPYVAFFVLLVALIEASFILPAHILREKRWSVSPLRNLQDWLDGVRDLVVPPAVSWSVRNIPLALTFAILDVPTVAYALKHDDADALVMAATKIKSFMTAMPGLCGISDSVALGKRIFEIHLTPGRESRGPDTSVGRKNSGNHGDDPVFGRRNRR